MMWKEALHDLIGLPFLLASLSFGLPICSSSAINRGVLDASEAAISVPTPQAIDAPANSMSIPVAITPQKSLLLLLVAGIVVSVAIFLVTYCIAYRTIFLMQGEWNQRSRVGGTVSEEQNSNGGLEASLVSSLPIVSYSAGMLKEGSWRMKGPHEKQNVILWGKECAVCLSEFEESEEMKVLPVCGHCFHKACINTWLLSHATCPICRLSLLKQRDEAKHAADPAIERSASARELHVAVDI